MADIRDSIQQAVDKALQELRSKPDPVPNSFAGSDDPSQKSELEALLERIREILFDEDGRQRFPVPAATKAVDEAAAVPAPAPAAPMPDKVIVTNRARLVAKYGDVSRIEAALQKLIAADAGRKIKTQIIALDDAKDMAAIHAAAVSGNSSQAAWKAAIDAVFTATTPDYLAILGGPDVVPLQNLLNPMGDQDREPNVPSDLPYACETPYSENVQDFTGPTRVVGRIPDLPAATDPSLLIKALETAAGWQARKATAYTQAFGLSAQSWQGSTDLSMQNLFGAKASSLLSPPHMQPPWTAASLQPLAHFINCHGAPSNPDFYGEDANTGDHPISHRSSVLKTLVKAGTNFDGMLVAAECCYGGELYDPSVTGDTGICASYLAGGAYAYVGATNTAYGPASGNGQADILCQKFLKKAIGGASTGRALLEARLDYISGLPELGPADLKTLAQFYLLGDPSIAPVQVPAMKSFGGATTVSEAVGRAERRKNLASRGESYARTKPVVRRQRRSAAIVTPDEVQKRIDEFTKRFDLETKPLVESYEIDKKGAEQSVSARFEAKMIGAAPTAPPQATNVHLVIAKRRNPKAPAGLSNLVAMQVKESGGKVLSVTELLSK